ncbi:MAG: hypothetical protein IT463_06855 [Planctomycetes bacterium]|nr:hypothetical protein [Planctomycetota bacterium]
MGRIRLGAYLLLPALLSACQGDYDQREEEAKVIAPGGGSTGSTANPGTGAYVRGTVSVAGAVDTASVTLRPVLADGSVDWADANALGSGFTFSNGIYQVNLLNGNYRGPIVVEVRGQSTLATPARGGNPATASTAKWHAMQAHHALYSVLPHYDGMSVGDVHVTPLTTVAFARALSFDGSIAGVQGGAATGLFGLCCLQVAEFFGLGGTRATIPQDFAGAGSFGSDYWNSYAITALSQVAADAGVSNVFDFYRGMADDALDDGRLNGSIGVVPGTGIAMPNLGSASLVGNALRNNYLAPGNAENLIGVDNTQIATGSSLDLFINTLDSARTMGSGTWAYSLVVRVPGLVEAGRGAEVRTSMFALRQIPGGERFDPLGDSAGPSFVQFGWVSSSPANVSVNAYGRIAVAPAAPNGDYTLTLTVQPAAGQTFVTGPTETHVLTVRVR